jgi:hypothetical protein
MPHVPDQLGGRIAVSSANGNMADPAGWRCIHSKHRSRNKAAYVVGGLGQEMDKKKAAVTCLAKGVDVTQGPKCPKIA